MGDNVTNTSSVTPSFNMSAANSTVTRDPWSGAVPYLGDIANRSAGLQDPYGQPYQTALNGAAGAQPAISLMQLNQLNHLNSIASGSNAPLDALGQYKQLFDQSQQVGNPTGALTDTQQAILDQNANRIALQQASLYSGAGRYGSAGAGIGMARGIAETNNPLIAQFNQQGIQNYLNSRQLGLGITSADAATRDAESNREQLASFQHLQAQDAITGRQQAWNAMIPDMKWADLGRYAQAVSAFNPVLANAGSSVTNANQSSSGTSSTTGQTSTPTPWTTYAGLGIAGIGALVR